MKKTGIRKNSNTKKIDLTNYLDDLSEDNLIVEDDVEEDYDFGYDENTNKEEENAEIEENEEDEIFAGIDDIIYNDFEKRLLEHDDFEEELTGVSEVEDISLEQAVQDFQNGVPEAFDYIYNQYRPKLERLSSRKNDQDLLPELGFVLWKATETFNKAGGAKFNTYYWKCARNHMGTLNIRKNAKKRTAEHGTVSMQQTVSNKDSEIELGAFIEDKNSNTPFDNELFKIFLEENIYPHLKKSEISTIKMLLNGYTLEEIGQELGGITAPAVHVKLRRLADKKIIGKQLRDIYDMYIS